MTTAISSGLRIVAAVQVTEFEGQGMPSNRFRDRRIVVTLDCGDVKNVGLPIGAAIPRVGEVGRCLRCQVETSRKL